jgi:uncharacterized protein (DUF1501 family)
MLPRRGFLAGMAAAAGLAVSGVGLAGTGTGERRLVLVLLRGGLDGLAAVPALGDPDYRRLRRDAFAEGAIDLNGDFGLHPALSPLRGWFDRRELAFVHAVAPPYRGRSHFDGQDVLENGTSTPRGRADGWLNRALGALAADAPPALAIGADLPLVLRGPTRVPSLDPVRRANLDTDFLTRVERLYASDPLLGPALSEAIDAREVLPGMGGSAGGAEGGRGAKLIRATAALLAAADGPRVATLDVGGWDTHQGEAGALDRKLQQLAAGLTALRDGLGAAWQHTVVVMCTEFGRTVSANGTGGTDHGTGGLAWLAGGAVAGGRVYGDWPGLSPKALLDGRDLRPTTDLRAVFKGVLRDHLGVRESALETTVFPDSRGAVPLSVVRT